MYQFMRLKVRELMLLLLIREISLYLPVAVLPTPQAQSPAAHPPHRTQATPGMGAGLWTRGRRQCGWGSLSSFQQLGTVVICILHIIYSSMFPAAATGRAPEITTDSVPSCQHHKRNPQQRTHRPESWRPLGRGLVCGRRARGGAGGSGA